MWSKVSAEERSWSAKLWGQSRRVGRERDEDEGERQMEGRGRRRSEGGTRTKGRAERLEEDLDGVWVEARDGEGHRGREDDKLKSESRCRRESERKGAEMKERFREGWGQNGTDRDNEKKSSSKVSSGVEEE